MNVRRDWRRATTVVATAALAGLVGQTMPLARSANDAAQAPPPEAQAVTIDAEGAMHLPARTIPVPATISPEAQKALASPQPEPPAPPVGDRSAWHAAIAAYDAQLAEHSQAARNSFAGKVDARELGGVHVYELTPESMPPKNNNRLLLYLHSGGYVFGAGQAGLAGAFALANSGFRVFSVDYRMAPDHPYPAALDDAVTVYREAIKRYQATSVGIVGVASGGGLAAATVLKLREVGLPLPGAVALLSPEADLTEAGDTIQTNRDIDVVLRHSIPETVALYAGGTDLKDPYLSPVYGDFAKGYCPAFLQSGTRDLLLSDTVRLHRALRRAGVEAELHVFEAMPHIGFSGAPEDEELRAEEVRFLDKHLGRY
jgi:acetyl esterase/lipase